MRSRELTASVRHLFYPFSFPFLKTMIAPLFHLAIPVKDLTVTREFYCEKLGCTAGRETTKALIFNLYGHQIVAHLTDEILQPAKNIYPRHFGLIFATETDWQALIEQLKQQEIPFYQSPKWRFQGEETEHATFFIEDPFYNLLEFKFYRYPEAIFGSHDFKAIGDRPS